MQRFQVGFGRYLFIKSQNEFKLIVDNDFYVVFDIIISERERESLLLLHCASLPFVTSWCVVMIIHNPYM